MYKVLSHTVKADTQEGITHQAQVLMIHAGPQPTDMNASGPLSNILILDMAQAHEPTNPCRQVQYHCLVIRTFSLRRTGSRDFLKTLSFRNITFQDTCSIFIIIVVVIFNDEDVSAVQGV